MQARRLAAWQACSPPGPAESPESKPYSLCTTRPRKPADSMPVPQGGEVGGGEAEGGVVNAELGKETEDGAFVSWKRSEVMSVTEIREATDAAAV